MTRRHLLVALFALLLVAPALRAEAPPTTTPESVGLSSERLQRLHAGEHPFYWAGFVPHGDGAAVTSTRVIPWLWIAALSLLGASAAFYAWWRKQRYELL